MEGAGDWEEDEEAGDDHLDEAGGAEEEVDPPVSPPNKRLCLEYLGSDQISSSDNSRDSCAIAMDNSSEVVTKIAGLYAERLMSDVILVVGEFRDVET